MSLEYEPSSERLGISAKKLSLNRNDQPLAGVDFRLAAAGQHRALHRQVFGVPDPGPPRTLQ